MDATRLTSVLTVNPETLIAFLYPGQGAQVAGMLHRLPDLRELHDTINEANQVLGCDVLELDTEKALTSTIATQLALLISGVAVTRALQAKGSRPDLVCGMSVGAFGAAVASGAISFADALPFVRLRAELTEKAYPKGYGLSAVVGLTEQQLAKIVDEINRPESPVFIANLNAPLQIVIAGSDNGMDAVLERAKREGASSARRLEVNIPSHCPLLQAVASELTRYGSTVEMRAPDRLYISNRRARGLRDPDSIREDLATNIAYPVRWHDSIMAAYERGIRIFIELPPGHTLTNLVAAALPDARCLAVTDASIESAARLGGNR
jgi:malonate decarboxylase epsilon subunit